MKFSLVLATFYIIIFPDMLITIPVTTNHQQNVPCLHKGCCLSGGLFLENFGNLVKERNDDFANTLKFLTWNLFSSENLNDDRSNTWAKRRRHICNFINAVHPDVSIINDKEVITYFHNLNFHISFFTTGVESNVTFRPFSVLGLIYKFSSGVLTDCGSVADRLRH